jgi:hypothetical protein
MSVYEREEQQNNNKSHEDIGECEVTTKEFNKWEDLEHLDPNLLRGIYAVSYTHLTLPTSP